MSVTRNVFLENIRSVVLQVIMSQTDLTVWMYMIFTVYSKSDMKYASTLCEQNSEFSSINAGGSERIHNAEGRHSHSLTLLSNQWNLPSSYSVGKHRSWTRYGLYTTSPTRQYSDRLLGWGQGSILGRGHLPQLATFKWLRDTINLSKSAWRFPRGNIGRNVKMTSLLHLIPRFVMPQVWFSLALSTVTAPPLRTDSNKLVPDDRDRNVRSLTPSYIKQSPNSSSTNFSTVDFIMGQRSWQSEMPDNI